MSIQITVTLPISSDDLLVGYSAGAKVYLYSSTLFAGPYNLVTSTAIISGTESYEIWDAAGTDTTWYESRIGNAGASLFSDYSTPFQVGSQTGYTNLIRVKRQLKLTDTSDDEFVQDCVDSANAWLTGEVGRFYGPSTDTVRTFDIGDGRYYSPFQMPWTSSQYPHALYIPDGLRSFTKCEMKLTSSDTSWIDVTVDVLMRPQAWNLPPGLEADRLVFTDRPTLGYYSFYPGYQVARVTGVFGPAVPPLALTRIADSVAVWLYQARQTGATGIVGSLETGEIVINRVLSGADVRTIHLYRGAGPSMYAMPAF